MTIPAGPPDVVNDLPAHENRSLVGTVISERYRVDGVLGEGGMGAVYSAEHLLIRKRVAIKVLHAEMTRIPEAIARFEREAMAAAHIEHPNVAAATDFGKLDDGSFFLVLEYIEGRSLRDEVHRGPMAVGRAMHIARQILLALVRAHGLGIVHRDLKPENVMLIDRDGEHDFVKVLDFGIARVPVSGLSKSAGMRAATPTEPGAPVPALTRLGMIYGTPEYMAPEQAMGSEIDHRADLYALGVMLFEMLTGSRPFDAADKVEILGMVVSRPVPPMADVAPGRAIPAPLETFTRRLLAKLAAQRFSDAREALDALDEIAREMPPEDWGAAGPPAALGALSRGFPESTRQRHTPSSASSPWAPLAARARALPLTVQLAGAASGVVLVGLIAVLLLGSPRSEVTAAGLAGVSSAPTTMEAPARATASDDDVRSAMTGGLPSLEGLRKRFPTDPTVLRALAKAQLSAKQPAAAVATLDAWRESDASALDDRDFREGLLAAAQSAEGDDAAFGLLASPALKAVGPDILYDIALAKAAAPAASRRAYDELAKPEVRANASSALRLALDLRTTKACEKLKPLFREAKESGDARALPFLEALTPTHGCGFLRRSDCNPCLHSDGSLAEAIRAINARRGKGPRGEP